MRGYSGYGLGQAGRAPGATGTRTGSTTSTGSVAGGIASQVSLLQRFQQAANLLPGQNTGVTATNRPGETLIIAPTMVAPSAGVTPTTGATTNSGVTTTTTTTTNGSNDTLWWIIGGAAVLLIIAISSHK